MSKSIMLTQSQDNICSNPSRRSFFRGKSIPNHPILNTAEPMQAQFSKSCLAHHNVVCHTCGEMCAVGAIRLRPRVGGAAIPEIRESMCTGCGECLSLCPTQAISLVNYSKKA